MNACLAFVGSICFAAGAVLVGMRVDGSGYLLAAGGGCIWAMLATSL